VRDHLAGELAFQGDACQRLGSPLYAALMERAAADTRAGGIIADLLAPWADQPRGAAIVLRLFGTVHRLALSGRAPDLARWYPSCGGVAPGDVEASDTDAAWAAFVATCQDLRAEVEDGLTQPPQTNEVGRSVALRGGLDLTADLTGLPLRLRELGASAGLNLRPDQYRIGTTDGDRGPADSPVVFPDAWQGDLPAHASLEIVDREGCDIAPLDPASEDDALRLQSYVWPDQLDRVERMRGALQVAARVPARVVAMSAPDYLDDLRPVPGVVTVIQHSVMWQYMSDEDRAAAQGELDRLRDQATADAPVARVALEPHRTEDDRDVDFHGLGFVVTWACWPHVDMQIVAHARPHGPPVAWIGSRRH
jgi:hypothetical protein